VALKEEFLMNRKLAVPAVVMMLLAVACGSMNRMTPRQMDDTAIEADVRGKIAEAVPSKTFAVEVNVDHGVVTLKGDAANETDIRAIEKAANSVHGVKSVINNIHVKM
jgi:osmotically-inducible protein OsmY